ncbi:MAG: TIGR00730 family Rossman fold protein [Halieaceae bacterium]
MSNSSVCIYCGSSPGDDPVYMDSARRIGTLIAEQGHRLVYGGGHVGLMGAAADAALAAGGEVIGVIPQDILDKEVGHGGVTELFTVSSMHERKMKMASLSDCFIALPGGIGTLEEIIEVMTWGQLGFHNKACGVLNIAGFFNPLLQLLDHMVAHRFLKSEHRDQLLVAESPEAILSAVLAHEGVTTDKWLDRV